MKTSAFFRPILLPLASIAFLAAPLSLKAQEAAKPAPPPAAKRIDVKISEAPLIDVVRFLREQFPEWNFACKPEIAHIKISDIQLHSATARDAAMAVWRASDVIDLKQPDADDPNDHGFLFRTESSDPDPLNVKTGVEAFSLKDAETVGQPPFLPMETVARNRENRMVQIQRMVSGTIDSIRSQGVLPVGEEPRFQFYPEANVLIAIGSRDGIEITRKIVNAFNDSHYDLAAERQNTQDIEKAKRPAASPSPDPNH